MTKPKPSLEIVRKLGAGGMATVYLARLDGHDVAVKKLHAFLADDPASVAMMEDEARLMACVRHPNVVGVIDFEMGAEPTVVMEFVEGIDLGQLTRAASRLGIMLPLDVVAAITCDVLAGLHAAHECRRHDLPLDIVHRDVSPHNVLVGLDGVARVTDFGVAMAAERTQHTEDGVIKGKLGYLAPEQLSSECDRRSDVYAVGAVLWELLTGSRLRAGSGVELVVEILCASVDPPSDHRREAAPLDDVVLRALERSPSDRFATAEAMREALARALTPASPSRVAEVVRLILDAEEDAAPESGRRSAPRERAISGVVPAVRVASPAPRRARQR
jgi:serine/threonine-protein kinase